MALAKLSMLLLVHLIEPVLGFIHVYVSLHVYVFNSGLMAVVCIHKYLVGAQAVNPNTLQTKHVLSQQLLCFHVSTTLDRYNLPDMSKET
jgi:hypothetical protein